MRTLVAALLALVLLAGCGGGTAKQANVYKTAAPAVQEPKATPVGKVHTIILAAGTIRPAHQAIQAGTETVFRNHTGAACRLKLTGVRTPLGPTIPDGGKAVIVFKEVGAVAFDCAARPAVKGTLLVGQRK